MALQDTAASGNARAEIWRQAPTEVLTVDVAGYLHIERADAPERLYELGTLLEPEVPGSGRTATSEDFPLVAAWFQAFGEEVGMHLGNDLPGVVQRRIERGDVRLWTVDGVPVSMAAVSPAIAGMCRIGPVYTPHSHRRQGYGAAVTADISATAMAERAERVVLFTDLDNPTSNAIYQSIGYRPVADYAHIVFEAR